MAKYFKEGSLEERGHAEMLMEYQNRRGGRVALKNILMPEMEFNNAEKGEALYAMELALSLEKLNFSKLRELHAVGSKHEDASMTDFIEGGLLDEQIASVKRVSEYVSQLRRVGKGLGVYHFDKSLA
uniref:Ferritin n=2 Tax=Chlamydomonas euryale TaxID=1486919 RepID=A0A7R9VMH7_9CHLO|mmetsp:Transcript_39875/g.118742  ORF Transcript_39875/g.118742 Transcript_39875/m.118742 type:complete len:127 (+) Transcript_39875:642-1022(+)